MKYHFPWQTGMTGVGADTTVTGEITSGEVAVSGTTLAGTARSST